MARRLRQLKDGFLFAFLGAFMILFYRRMAQNGQPKKALKGLTWLVDNLSTVGVVHNDRGFAYLKLGRVQEAHDDLQRATEVDPRLSMAHSNLGLTL
ncbi:MAG: tetratricopeptide repeat protein [Candidatus Eremiobacteraeota bacterium]|nr:tetratricopeptide repeat protein [Candidatus Eremiobacteraeota bacterium]